MSSTELFIIARRRHKPREKAAVLNQRLPPGSIPAHVLRRGRGGTWLTAKQDDDSVGFRRDKSKEENVLRTAIIAFEGRVAKRGLGMELYFFVSSSNQVIDNMRRACISSSATKPLIASKTLNYRARRMDTAIPATNTLTIQ